MFIRHTLPSVACAAIGALVHVSLVTIHTASYPYLHILYRVNLVDYLFLLSVAIDCGH